MKKSPGKSKFSGFPNSLRWPRERRDRGLVKKSSYQKILSSNGRNLGRFVKTRINGENEGLKNSTFSVPRPPPTRRGRLKQSIRQLRRRLWGSAGKNSFYEPVFDVFGICFGQKHANTFKNDSKNHQNGSKTSKIN